MILMLRCACAGSSNKAKSEADSDDISEHPRDDKPRPYSCTVCHKRFTRHHSLNLHRKRHTGQNVYSCTLCEKRFPSPAACVDIWIFIQVNISAQNVADVVPVTKTLQFTDEVIQERNSLNVLFVAKDLQHHITLLCTVEFTVERNRTNVTCVRKHLVSLQLCTDTCESIREINRTTVHCVTKVSADPAACSYINVKYTATEDSMTVLTVGSCLRWTAYWSVMFVFTLLQSRTHVDTVHSVLHSQASSRDICWRHTMKVLGWHVTSVRWNLATVVTSSSIYFDMQVWSLMYVVSVQSVSVQGIIWNLINWVTQTTNSLAVVCVVNISNTNVLFCNTLRNVLLSWDLVTFNLRVDLYLLLLSTHFSFSALTLFVGWQKGHPACKKLDVGLLVMIWLELYTTYSSSSPVTTTTSIICFNKHQLTQVHLENGR